MSLFPHHQLVEIAQWTAYKKENRLTTTLQFPFAIQLFFCGLRSCPRSLAEAVTS